jgi:hypothetical protein
MGWISHYEASYDGFFKYCFVCIRFKSSVMSAPVLCAGVLPYVGMLFGAQSVGSWCFVGARRQWCGQVTFCFVCADALLHVQESASANGGAALPNGNQLTVGALCSQHPQAFSNGLNFSAAVLRLCRHVLAKSLPSAAMYVQPNISTQRLKP